MHELADVTTITKRDEAKTEELEAFLVTVITEWRSREGEQFPFKLVRILYLISQKMRYFKQAFLLRKPIQH